MSLHLISTHTIRSPHAALPRYQMFSQHCKLRCINQFAQLKVLRLVGGGPWTSRAPHVLRAVSGSPRRLRVLLTAAEMWNIMLKNGLHQPYRFSGRLRLDRGPHSRALPGFKKTVLSNVSLSNAVCRQAASLCAALYMVTTAEF